LKRMTRETDGGTETQKETKKKKKFPFIHILSCLFAVFILYSFNANYARKTVEYKEKQTQVQQVGSEITDLEKENRDLKQQVSHLNTNEGVEEIAREKLGLIKPDEIAFVVVSSPTPQSPAAQAATRNPDSKMDKNQELKKEIRKESAREEGWFKKILNFMGRR
jgi:cell division protein FtsL